MASRGRFLMVTWDGGGNLPPFLGVAERLLARGHEVRLLGPPQLEARVKSVGMGFQPYISPPPFDPDQAADAQMQRLVLYLAGDQLAAELREELRRHEADVLIVDCMLLGAMCAAEKSSLPVATLVHFLYAAATAGGAAVWEMMRPLVDATRETNGLIVLDQDRRILDQMWGSCALVIVATARAFDEPLAELAANVRYAGPIPYQSGQRWAWDLPWPFDDPTPLVGVSLSTTPQNQQDALQRIIDAMAGLDAHVIVTYGQGVDGTALRLPDNVVSREFVPHAALLPHLSLMITHAGHGTAINSLAAGVPLVCLPMGRDQPFVAARVAACGAGVVVPSGAPTSDIRTAVEEVLSGSNYRENARRLSDLIAAEMAASEIVSDLEQLLPTG